ncbi:PLD nuclease N-terminal domain-containing protein [Leifsonia aquatica]|uniref:PLD nuclease N-terminal domain-containing protein n=1 Tax=Leifsonia aquatica TaxID=144185 RepID=UPI000468CEF4|nr:PLD nuclease N-terminal domain-containing protein [Leifsonia aquatica]
MLSGLAGWHLMILFLGVGQLALWLVALVQVALSRTTAAYVIAWIAIVTLVPVIGPILWLTLGRANAPRNQDRLSGGSA